MSPGENPGRGAHFQGAGANSAKVNVVPRLTRTFIRTSFLYLLAGLLVGILIAWRSTFRLPPIVNTLSPVYFHLFLVGWVTQLIFGVINWLFPKADPERPWEERFGWAALILINSGLLLRAIAEPLNGLAPGTFWGWLLVASSLLQWFAALSFVAMVWPRVYVRKRRRR